MLKVTPTLFLNEAEINFSFIRSPGPGGQNVNKVASAVLLRFNVLQSPSLPDDVRERLINLAGNKINFQGELLIKATRFRKQERNKQDALDRLLALILQASIKPKRRRKTKPTKGSIERRLTSKKIHGKTKALRGSRHGDKE